MTSTKVFNPPHLTQIPLFISKPLSLLLGTIFAQSLCSHINVAAFPWQVKQFTNTRRVSVNGGQEFSDEATEKK